MSFMARKQEVEVFGFTNRCMDGLYVIFIDYDGLDEDWIIGELRRLQDEFGLSTFYLSQSSRLNHHAICLDKVPLNYFLDILKNSSVDYNYMRVPLNYGRKTWTLRTSEKRGESIKFKGILPSSNKEFKKSLAHAMKLSEMFNIPLSFFVEDKKEFDEENELIISKYKV